MKGRARKRRLILFVSLSLVAAAALATAGYFYTRPQFQVRPWEEMIGVPEQAALNEAIAPATEDPAEDPFIAIPGIDVEPGSRSVTDATESTLFRGHPRPTSLDDLYLGIGAYWSKQGARVRREKRLLTAKHPNGDGYFALWNNGTGEDGQILLWRVRELKTTNLGVNAGQEWPEKYAGIFPDAPQGQNVMQMGRPGYPGYCITVASSADPAVAFKALAADLQRRGWKPFYRDLENSMNRQLEGPPRPAYSMLFRHATAPFGCQLHVERDAKITGGTSVLLAIF